MFSFPKRANFECYSGDEFPDKSIQTFGHNFEAKGNFTFSWEQAVHNSDLNYLCGAYMLIIKEFTRRVQYNAIPFYVNQTNSSKYDLSQIGAAGMFVEKVIGKELDLFINFGIITNMMSKLGRISVPGTIFEPTITILGSTHPNIEQDRPFAFIGIFDNNIWFLMFMSALSLTLMTSLDTRVKNWANKWLNEMWNVFSFVCLKNFKLKSRTNFHYMSYGLIILVSLFLLTSFSSLILSRTIKMKPIIIDDLDQLLSRKDIKLYMIFYRGGIHRARMFGTELIKSVIEQSIANNAMEFDPDFNDIALRAYEIRTMLKTHCMLSSRFITRLLKGDDNNLYIGRKSYFDVTLSLFYSKHLNPILFNAMEKLFYDINESALRDKWVNEALDFGWKILGNKQEVVITDKVFGFTLSNFKIASGPLFFGQIVSVLVLILERNFRNICNYIHNKNSVNTREKPNVRRRGRPNYKIIKLKGGRQMVK